jgi:hypothetical protein
VTRPRHGLQIPSAASLGFLHDVIQVAFGWEGYHLHQTSGGSGGWRRSSTWSPIRKEEPPEHLGDLVAGLRAEGYDPGAFDPAELTRRLSSLSVRTAVKATRTVQPAKPRAGTQAEVFPVSTLPPHADLAARARLAPLVRAALRLAQWCAPGVFPTLKLLYRIPNEAWLDAASEPS